MQLTDLRFAPDQQLRLAFDVPTLSPGLGLVDLTFPVSFDARWPIAQGDASAVQIEGALYCTNRSAMRLLGHLHSQTLFLRPFPTNEQLSVSLTAEQLLALDRLRQGIEDLEFSLHLVASPLWPQASPGSMQAQIAIRVPAQVWIASIDQIGGHLAITIRLLMPFFNADGSPTDPNGVVAPSQSQVVGHLRKARRQLRDGDPESAVATCRLVLDGLALLAPLPATAIAKKPRDRTQEERWAMVHHDLHSLLSAAHHHDASTQSFEWTVAEAEAAIASVSGLARRVLRSADQS